MWLNKTECHMTKNLSAVEAANLVLAILKIIDITLKICEKVSSLL